LAFFLCLLDIQSIDGAPGPVVEPWQELNGGDFVTGRGAALNPDPMRDYAWNLTRMVNASAPQLIRVLPVLVQASPATSFVNSSTLINSTDGNAHATGAGTLVIDFGVELAAWIELRSPDLTLTAVAAGCVSMSVGESKVPQFFSPSRLSPHVKNATNPLFAGWKTDFPVAYAGGIYRLELNAQLYEGVRYGFLHVNASCGSFQPFTIEEVSARAQVKPANWASFATRNNSALERAWYVGGYTVKLNMQGDAIGSILDQRGDRTPKGKFVGFAGDAHPTQATAMVAFGAFELVKSMQKQLGEINSLYGTYLMYWVLSLSDYFAATGDSSTTKQLLVPAHNKMRRAYNRLTTPIPANSTNGRTRYAGWDERFNFAHVPYFPENEFVMRALYVQVS
jgi:hypothetical protein